jgi:hypothetical protein
MAKITTKKFLSDIIGRSQAAVRDAEKKSERIRVEDQQKKTKCMIVAVNDRTIRYNGQSFWRPNF